MNATDTPDKVAREGAICQSCGACCAAFRVSFYWREPEVAELGSQYTESLSPHLLNLKGTNQAKPHCFALHGAIGENVRCEVYPHRPSPCREVQIGDEKCQRARAIHGLPTLTTVEKADSALPSIEK